MNDSLIGAHAAKPRPQHICWSFELPISLCVLVLPGVMKMGKREGVRIVVCHKLVAPGKKSSMEIHCILSMRIDRDKMQRNYHFLVNLKRSQRQLRPQQSRPQLTLTQTARNGQSRTR